MSSFFAQKNTYKIVLVNTLLITSFFLNFNAFSTNKVHRTLDENENLLPQTLLVEQTYLYDQQLDKKERITFKKGDLEAIFGGMIKVEYYFYDDLTFLNKHIPEQIGAFKQTIDLTSNIIFGKKKYGHKAFESFLDLRSKQKWGVVGAYRNTTETEVKLNDVSLGEHTHYSSRPVPWFKDAWMKISWNSILSLKTKNLHKIKFGWFPFAFGRGIALGSAYATIYEGLGLYNYFADSSAPGIKLKGEIIKSILKYDLYYAKFEDKSISCRDTFNTVKKNHVGRKYNPWRGVAKDDELWGARLRWKAYDNKYGCLKFEPYFFYDEASDQKVEVKNDAHTEFGSYGLRTNYTKGGFEFDAEFAFNYGHEDLANIDRNSVVINFNNLGNLEKQYSHIVDENGNKIIIYDSSQTLVNNSTDYQNSSKIGTLDDYPHKTTPVDVYNNSNRFRPAFRNKLDGWMCVSDISYTVNDWNLTFATELAYASGDYDPHALDREYNKTFKGFVGLHEIFHGNKVRSAILAGEREINVPLSLEANKYEKDGYYVRGNPVFNDKKYIGFSLNWKPKKLTLNPNVIFFWKTSESYKYLLDIEHPDNSHSSATEKASKFIGTEANIIMSYEMLADLKISAVFAFFFPGTYYKDVKGVPLKNDYYRKEIGLSDPPPPGVNIANYRISDDTAFFLNVGVSYMF
ncbi:hypothetical protein ACFLYH_00530 [Candidatus Dependentiae bacterium]